MKPTKNLFELIHSMSQGEKKAFTLYASRHVVGKKNNYVKLFEAIERQKKYDEAKIKKMFANEKFVKHLNWEKNFLYNLILKSLRTYHEKSRVSARLNSYLSDLENLFQKGLYSHTDKIIPKAKALANKYDEQWYMLMLLLLEITRVYESGYEGKTEKEMDKLVDDMFDSIDKMKNLIEYTRLTAKMQVHAYKQGVLIRNPEDMDMLKKINNHPLLKSDFNARTYQAKITYNAFKVSYYGAKENYKQRYKYLLRNVKLQEDNPHQIEENISQYIMSTNNLIRAQIDLKKYNEADKFIAKVKSLKVNSESLAMTLFFTSSISDLFFCIKTGDFSRGLKTAREVDVYLLTLKYESTNKARERVLYYHCAIVFFATGDYNKAKQYVNKIINDTNSDLRNDLLCFSTIFNLIIHFELGNQFLLEYAVKSTYRFLYRRNRLYKFETTLLNFIRKKVPKISSPKMMISEFRELKKEMEKLFKNPFEKRVLEYFDFISWLESKIENRLFSDIVREKAESHLK